jgi:hypothetical protein
MMKQMMALLLMFLPMQQTKHPDTVMDTVSTPETEVSWSTPKIRNNRKIYTLDVKKNWTCVPSSNSVSLVTITCVKSDSRGEAQ